MFMPHLNQFEAPEGFPVKKMKADTKLTVVMYCPIFKASALWADAFYKSISPSLCPSLCLSVHFLRYRLNVFLPPPSEAWFGFGILGEK